MILNDSIRGIYRSQAFGRKDNPMKIFHFGPEDYPGLQVHPYVFSSRQGQVLQGYFYHYENPIADRLLVFDHGMGNGHRAYMREIERLAKAGFLVFAYDHTGCMESGGDGTNGLAQSLSDLDACISVLKYLDALKDRRICVMGHSWGGFSTMNICALHPEITHIVAMSGFVSVEQMINQKFTGLLKRFRKTVLELEHETNPNYAGYHAIDSLEATNARVLLIYSDNDTMIKKRMHYDKLVDALSYKDNIRFLLVHGRGHNATYTHDAVKYKNTFFAQLEKRQKKDSLRTDAQKLAFMGQFDWNRMTQQDDTVWDTILETLEVK